MIQRRLLGRDRLVPLRPVRFVPIGLAVSSACAVAACIGPSYAVRIYAERPPSTVRVGDEGYKIFDRSDLGRLLVAPEIDGSQDVTRSQASAAASRFLADAKRGACRVSDGSVAARPFTEVVYRCERLRAAAASVTASTARPVQSSPPAHAEGGPVTAPRAQTPPPPPSEAFTLRMNRL